MRTEPMENLVYLCSLGKPAYRRMTELCVRSLRRVAEYEGPIRVFTNNGYRASEPDVEVSDVPGNLDEMSRYTFKAAAGRWIEGERYTAVVWMDSDMIAVDTIEPLFHYSRERVCGMVESPWVRMTDPACGECLTEGERRRARRRWGINSGLLCFPGRLFRECTEVWLAETERRRRRLRYMHDQPVFNALVASGRIRFRAYPRRWIDMPPLYFWRGGRFRVTDATRVLHFCWPAKRQAIKEMEVFLDQFENGDDWNRRTEPPIASQ